MKKMLICVFVFLNLSVNFARAEFSQTTLRYISGYDFENKITSIFDSYFLTLPPLKPFYPPSGPYGICFQSADSAASQFGFNSAATGSPLMQAPNSATIQAVKMCIQSIMDVIGADPQGLYLKKIIPEPVFQKLSTTGYSFLLASNVTNQFTDDEIKLLISNLIEQILGTDEVILSYGLINSLDAYRSHLFSKVDKNKKLDETILKLITALILRDEFLMY
jgi:hypothetical protein